MNADEKRSSQEIHRSNSFTTSSIFDILMKLKVEPDKLRSELHNLKSGSEMLDIEEHNRRVHHAVQMRMLIEAELARQQRNSHRTLDYLTHLLLEPKIATALIGDLNETESKEILPKYGPVKATLWRISQVARLLLAAGGGKILSTLGISKLIESIVKLF